MLKPLKGCGLFKKLKVDTASLVSEIGEDSREWACHTKSGKMFHLIYQHGVLQASNVVETEYDLELNSKPIATIDNLTDKLLYGFGKKNRNTVTFKDIINLMGWKIDDDQYFD
tara:strand:- start:302 stop:640 length:339 start_codon:yes stop_codon:yes gene_type:complete